MLVAVGADTLLKKTVGADITAPFVQKGIKALQVLEDLKNDELAYQAGGMRYWPLTNGFVTVSGLVVAPHRRCVDLYADADCGVGIPGHP